jgi:hypothetical protein
MLNDYSFEGTGGKPNIAVFGSGEDGSTTTSTTGGGEEYESAGYGEPEGEAEPEAPIEDAPEEEAYE